MSAKPYAVTGKRNSPLIMQYGTCDSFRHQIRGTKWRLPKLFISSQNYSGAHCYHKGDRIKLRKIMEQELRAGVYTKVLFDRIDDSFKRVVNNIKRFSKKDFSKASNEQLINYFDTYYEIYIVTLFPMLIAIYSSDLGDLFEKELRKALTKEDKARYSFIDLVAMLLTPPDDLSFVQKEEQLLFEIQQVFARAGKPRAKQSLERFCRTAPIRKKLKRLVAENGWFHMEYIGEPWREKQYVEYLWERIRNEGSSADEWKNAQSPRARINEVRRQQERFFKNHPKAKFLKRSSFALQKFAIVLDYSKADLIHGIYCARPLIEEIARRLGIESWVMAHNLKPDEVRAALERGKLTARERKDMRSRAKRYALLLKDGDILLYHGKRAQAMHKKLLDEPDTARMTEIRGITAMTGVVRGIAKIVTSTRDLPKFKHGDIMITRDVSTELTSIMKKAAAIVGDHGGLISHTAIVAREFKTPCIVKTQVATQVFKDGDMVEVDATRGVVRKIN